MQKRLFDALFLYIGTVWAQPEYCCPSEPARVNIISVIQRERSDNPRLGREPGEADRGRKGGARERT